MNELALAIPWLGKRNPAAARWVVILLAVGAPLIAVLFGKSWVRILDFAMLYVMLAIGLNLVVGFAGLLDLGYIAFYAVGAYTFAFLASPHFELHLPFWLVLPLGAVFAALAGIILGLPTLRLRGDYLAIVTLGFGEIVRIFMNNLNHPINITNGPQGINMIDPLVLFGWDISKPLKVGDEITINSLFLYYYVFLAFVVLSVILVQRLQVSAKNPDVIVYSGMDAQGGPMLKQIKQLGINAKFITGDGGCTGEIIKLAGDAIGPNAYCTQPGLPLDKMPGGKDFNARFKKRFNADVQIYAPYAYDAASAIVEAMKAANSSDPAKYAAHLGKVNFPGVIGTVAFDAKGDIKDGAVTVYQFKAGKWEPVQ